VTLLRGVALAVALSTAAWGTAFSPDEIRGLTEDRALLKGTPTVVVFLSAKCPVSNAYGDRLQRIYDDFRVRGVRFFFVNSNQNEDAAEIDRNAAEHHFTFSVFRDSGSLAADRFGAQSTPEVFVLDREARVVYRGSVDDAQNPARVHREALRATLEQVLLGVPVTVAEIKAFGCAIKRPRHVEP